MFPTARILNSIRGSVLGSSIMTPLRGRLQERPAAFFNSITTMAFSNMASKRKVLPNAVLFAVAGPHARGFSTASGKGGSTTRKDRANAQVHGRLGGCHHCGAHVSMFYADHVPPTSLMSMIRAELQKKLEMTPKIEEFLSMFGETTLEDLCKNAFPQCIFPQCPKCSCIQGGLMSSDKNKEQAVSAIVDELSKAVTSAIVNEASKVMTLAEALSLTQDSHQSLSVATPLVSSFGEESKLCETLPDSKSEKHSLSTLGKRTPLFLPLEPFLLRHQLQLGQSKLIKPRSFSDPASGSDVTEDSTCTFFKNCSCCLEGGCLCQFSKQ